jgi:hypothetical protein
MKRTLVLYLVLATAALLVLLSAGGWTVLAQTPPAVLPVTDTPEPGSEFASTPTGLPTSVPIAVVEEGTPADEMTAPTATGVLARFAVPVGVSISVVGSGVYLFFLERGGESAYAQLALT